MANQARSPVGGPEDSTRALRASTIRWSSSVADLSNVATALTRRSRPGWDRDSWSNAGHHGNPR
jgi:hypothetical protein